jgi:hypothetical protein
MAEEQPPLSRSLASGPASAAPSRAPSSEPRSSSRRAARSERPRRSWRSRELAALGAVGVLAAALLTVCTNVLAARFFKRWDVTSAGLYTLSPPTLETLRGLSDEVSIIVFLSQSDPDFGGLSRLLDQYRAESSLINVRYVDPDRDPAEFIALSNRYRLSDGRAEGGHLVSDAALVVVRGDARWVVGSDDISEYDEEHGLVQPRVEQSITEGLRQVIDPTALEVCFAGGQGEPSPDDGSQAGLGALAYMLRKNNYGTRELDLSAGSTDLGLSRCDLVVVAAPREPASPAAVDKLLGVVQQGKALLLSIGPALDEENRVTATGFEPLFDAFGVRLRPGLVFERDPEAVLPVGLGGETFLAAPKPHAITQGLLSGAEPRYRVLIQLGQALEIDPAGARSADGTSIPVVVGPLLASSERAFGVLDAAKLAQAGVDLDDLPHDTQGPFTLAIAAELPASGSGKRGGRVVMIGSGSPLLGGSWQDPTLAGTRRFVESAVSWLVSRPALVSLPDKPGRQVEMRFTEESLGEVVRYVLMYMPGTALALGALILVRRRSASAARPRSAPRDERSGGAA